MRSFVPVLAFLLAAAAAPPVFAQDDPALICDTLAGHPDDPATPGDGFRIDAMDVARAEPACRLAIEQHPEDGRYQLAMARVMRAKGEDAASVPFYEEAAKRGNTLALVGLGLLYLDSDEVEADVARAIGYFTEASEKGDPVGHFNLALMHDEGTGGAEDAARAAELYRMAIDGGFVTARIELASLYWDGRGVTQDKAEAERLFREAIALGSTEVKANALNSFAWVLAIEEARLDEAEVMIGEAMTLARPTDRETLGDYHDTRAWIRHLQGRTADAAADADAAVELYPEHAAFHERRGDIYAELGQEEVALAEWKRALELPDPYPGWDRAIIEAKIAEAGAQ